MFGRFSRIIGRAGLRGRVEGVFDDRLHGWAFDPAKAGRPVRLRVETASRRVETVADRYRADVHRAGFGDGACGFSVALDRLGRAGACRVFVVESGMELPGGPIEIGGPPPPAFDGRGRGYWLRLDPPGAAGVIAGFCVAADDPRRRIDLLLIDARNEVAARGRALRPRDDLAGEACDALHGFRLTGAPPRGRLMLAEARGEGAQTPIARRTGGVWRMEGAN